MINLFEKIIIIFLIIVALVILVLWLQFHFSFVPSLKLRPEQPMATIGQAKIKLEIADTPAKRYQGLSNRQSLCSNCGMLFVWPEVNGRPEVRQRIFVMRNMNFSLDIIWIKDNTIVKIDKNLAPEGAKPRHLYKSGQPVDYVLEVNGGFCEKNNIRVGDEVNIMRNG